VKEGSAKESLMTVKKEKKKERNLTTIHIFPLPLNIL
jgi:hypothetical protein